MSPESVRKLASTRQTRRHRHQPHRRLHVENLEERAVPALFNSATYSFSTSFLNNNGCVVTADFNKDGLDDAIMTNYGVPEDDNNPSFITYLRGKNGGGFNSLTLNTGGTNQSFAAVADINGDGWTDLVVCSGNQGNIGAVSVFANDGAGNLSLSGSFASGGNNACWIGLSDVTGDGFLDVVVSHFGAQSGEDVTGKNIQIFSGAGDFTFSSGPIETLADTEAELACVPGSLAIADFSGDGIKDIAVASFGIPTDFGLNYPPGVLFLYKGSGGGDFADPTQNTTGGDFPINIQAGDLNNDGRLDLVVANAGDPLSASGEFFNDSVGVLLNTSNSNNLSFGFPDDISPNTHGTFAVAIADFDMDGDQDVAAVNYGEYLSGPAPFVSMYMNNGSGTLAPPAANPTYNTGAAGDGGQYLAVGDFDNNGSPDVVVAQVASKVVVLTNTTVSGPTVTINQGASQNDPTNSTSIVYDVVFSEAVTGFTGSDISFAGSSSTSGLSASVTEITPSTYTVTVTGITGTGTVRASIPASAAISVANSSPTQASGSTDNLVAYDLVVPTVTINQASGQADPTSSAPIQFTVVFSEAVTGFTAGDVDLSDSSLTGLNVSVTQNTASNYTVSVNGMAGNGTVIAKLLAGAASDAAGNGSTASTSTDNSVTFQSISSGPGVTINQGSGQLDPTNSTSIVFDVVFAEGVTGFTSSDVDLSGSSVGGLSASVTQLTPATYTVTVTGMSGTGTVQAKIPANAATSIATLFPSQASTSTDNQVSFDYAAPGVTINQAAGQSDPATAGPILFTVAFTEGVTGFTASDVDLSDSSLTGLSASVTQNSSSNYTVSVTGMSGNGTVVAKLLAGAANDLAGNPSAASTSSDNSVTFSVASSPTVTINEGAGQDDPTAVPSIQFDVKFSEAVNGFTASDVSLTGSTAGGTLVVNVSGSGDTYVVTVTGMLTTGQIVASIPAGAANAVSSGQASLASSSTDNTVQFETNSVIGFKSAVFLGGEGVGNSNGSILVTLTRIGSTTGDVTVSYTLSDGTARTDGNAGNGRNDYELNDPTSTGTSTGTITWPENVGGDLTFTIDVLPDDLNEGKELINLVLSNLTGTGAGAATLGLANAVGAIAPSDGQGQGLYFDQDGDKFRIKLNGKVGSMQFFRSDSDGDGVGPIELIELSNTQPDPLKPKATLTVTVTKSKTSSDGGTVNLGAITGSGLRAISARKANLNGDGILLNGYLGSLVIGNILNGADIQTLSTSNPLQKTRINALTILDGTTIDVGATLANLTANAFGAGLLKAPRVGVMNIKGAMAADIDISGAGVSLSEKALGTLRVKGAVTGSNISVMGNVGSVNVGAFRDSQLFVGYTDAGDGSFNLEATLGSFRASGKTEGFKNSDVFATTIKTATIVNLVADNGDDMFGFYADRAINALKVIGPKFLQYDPTLSASQGDDNFEIRVI